MPSGTSPPAGCPLTPLPLEAKQAALLPWLSDTGSLKLFCGKSKNGTSVVGIGPDVGEPGNTHGVGITEALGKFPPEGFVEVKSNSWGLVKMSRLFFGLVIENC